MILLFTFFLLENFFKETKISIPTLPLGYFPFFFTEIHFAHFAPELSTIFI
jgi:hypothetical protein